MNLSGGMVNGLWRLSRAEGEGCDGIDDDISLDGSARYLFAREVLPDLMTAIDDDIQEYGAARYMFAWHRDALLYQGGLDNGHWLHAMIRHLDDEELSIELVNETHGARFAGEWVSVSVRFCDAYRIRLGSDQVEMTDDACYQGEDHGGDVIVPKGDASGYVLKTAIKLSIRV